MSDQPISTPQQVEQLDINLIQPNPHQPRKHIDPEELSELVESVKIHGVLEPIVIAHTPAGYQIIAGERRWRASQKAGLKTVPAIIKKTTPQGMLEMSIIENVQRSDLNSLERAYALERLHTDFHLTYAEIAKQISKSSPYVINSIRLLQLPDALKDGLLSSLISEGHARALQQISNPQSMIEAYKLVLKENASVRRAEDLARRYREDDGQERKTKHDHFVVSKDITRWQQDFSKALGENAKVLLRRSQRQTQVTIKLRGAPEETQAQLDKLLAVADQS